MRRKCENFCVDLGLNLPDRAFWEACTEGMDGPAEPAPDTELASRAVVTGDARERAHELKKRRGVNLHECDGGNRPSVHALPPEIA